MTELEILQNIYQLVMVAGLFVVLSLGILTGWFLAGRV